MALETMSQKPSMCAASIHRTTVTVSRSGSVHTTDAPASIENS
ncbi:MAG: hypothetical protein ACKVP1_17305 [Burkholderiaceae bacterium]